MLYGLEFEERDRSPGERTCSPTVTGALTPVLVGRSAGPFTSLRFSAEAMMSLRARTARDQDVRKGAIEDESPSYETNPPALDEDGLPNDETAIAQDALGANEDQSQG
jgi:hypothetical protein